MVEIKLTLEHARAISAVTGALGRSHVQSLINRGLDIELQPAMEALVALAAELDAIERSPPP